ncbi:hypothetical protein MPSEU_000946700 [Mayamaea pseudoterrestris]|nr:hypothetical protein MPSEU_000946700 [Mayamaea pseudoterrestris]
MAADDDSEGWFTTKKRGRDDDKIEADREKALLERRKKRNPNYKPKPAKQQKPKSMTASKKRRSKQDYDSDEEEDEDSFIEEESDVEADDDGDDNDEKEWNNADEENDDDEDELGHKYSDGDSSDDEQETFFKSYKPRSSIPPPKKAMKKSQTARPDDDKKKKTSKSSGGRLTKQSPKTKRAKPIEVNSSSDSDSDHDSDSSEDKVPRGTKLSKLGNGKTVAASLSLANQDSDLDSPLPRARMNKAATAARNTASMKMGDDSDDSDDEIPSASKLNQPLRPQAFASKPADVNDGNLSSPSPMLNRHGKKKITNKNKSHFGDDDSDDAASEAEAMAIALALSASESDYNNNNTQLSKTSFVTNNHKDEVELLDTDDDEQDDDEQDEYMNPEAKEAESLLETANALSKEILTTMLIWMNGGDSDLATDSATKTTVPMGMIVDGAVALSTVSALESGQPLASLNKSWISKETMGNVCPKVKLADYQLIGVNWLALMHGMKYTAKGTKGKHTSVNGVLADEMGLGKTVQTIAFLSWLKYSAEQDQKPGDGSRAYAGGSGVKSDDDSVVVVDDSPVYPHLIVVPSSVVSNWMREFETFAPHMNVVKYYGTQAERQDLQHELRNHLPGKQRPFGVRPVDVIVTPVTYFSSENPSDRNFLRKFQFNYLVCDEAHLLKNARGSRYKNLDRFSSLHRLLLTGTPINNRPAELLALLCFLMPLFGSRKYKSYEEEDANDGGEFMLHHFVQLEKGEDSSDEAAYRKLKQLFAPFVLRRKKEDVLGQIVPPKTVRVDYVELDQKARSVYDSIISNHLAAKKNGNFKDASTHLFTQLRKAAHHPLLIRSRHKAPEEKQKLAQLFHTYQAFQGGTVEQVAAELEKFNDFDIHHTALDLVEQNNCRRETLEPYILREDDLFCSTKFVRLRALLPELIEAGHRILIFSVWTSCLDLLGCLLEAMDIDFLRMDGSTPVKERQDLMDKFQTDATIPVFLLSTRACGLGITLTAADVCIMHDIDFNPSVDKQAEDRCHRIGQTKLVNVVKLVAKSTVDEDIYNMQERKSRMTNAIMENDDWQKHAESDKNDVLKAAIDRFLDTPARSGEKRSLNGDVARYKSSLV